MTKQNIDYEELEDFHSANKYVFPLSPYSRTRTPDRKLAAKAILNGLQWLKKK